MHAGSKKLVTFRFRRAQLLPLLLLLLLLLSVAGCSLFTPAGNATCNHRLSRSRRVAIFNGQGVLKFVCGLAFPIPQEDTVLSVWGFINYQNQFTPPPVPVYWWSSWNTSSFESVARDIHTQLEHDETRTWLYDVIETGLEQLDAESGAVCLLRSICEISQRPFQPSNLFGELLNAVLVPPLDNVAGKYLHARDGGRAGADCRRTYSDCSHQLWRHLRHAARITL
ncbi:uncharacterized protein LOC117585238 [Drosophila guanche]|uniref:Uncharacterized protein n=1 Tax=Drosophila guanche TaxID=7266 RepID=A0A3B0JM46_DROGU|nr:uncharacterized protein LOC117585238 [Drosophila guanche]SPP83327.1 Hypothetical predicted protein [Drosophila guanche]